MLNIPAIRWGKPYDSLEKEDVVHFRTGEPIAQLSQVGGGILKRDMKKAQSARDALLEFSPAEILDKMATAGKLYLEGDLPIGDGSQTPEAFVHAQSASTGLPEHMCRANMQKNAFVMQNMTQILDSLTRGLDLNILARGYGKEPARDVMLSYQAQSPVLGAVLPSNSPGVHTLWLPAVALQLGLVLKPGGKEPWTPYRIFSAMVEAGLPAEAFSLYPGAGGDVGSSLLSSVDRAMVFGGQQTIDQYAGNPKVQPHGPGFSKILLADDVVDDWPQYLDLMVQSVFANSGRSCINASGIWASRHTKEIAQAIAEKIGPTEIKDPTDDEASLAAFTMPGMAPAVWNMIESDLAEEGVTDYTAPYGERLVQMERCDYLKPMVIHAENPEKQVASKEYMFPFVSVVECPQDQMIKKMGYSLICTAITADEKFARELVNATHIDRLNIGPIPTHKVDWLQPHEGNIIEFLFRSRAYQAAPVQVAAT
ncbi:aldehyde dehydrogenase family protein [Blastopirellula marina]|uniref:Aldehyde dehydrogenase n=1 Tax=Blastopirellula marina TaxID=124 RepID=A0A2S8F872_9BACT|nr:aldehyde dehydrogenase family protein [Blastopirellula marina]PQO28330.1 aldehyde dehydrogenase [Blastopirellula marina]PTL41870.1 aldehyde dehydrogenase [Blastopirellula marina]